MTIGRIAAPRNIRRLTLGNLSDEELQSLVHHGEDVLVECKLDLPKPPRFGAAVASLANTLGGWLLLGVNDDGEVKGWSKDERLDLQSHLGAVLRREIDPIPPFVAGMREVDGKPIGVVRVFESADAPHIVRGTGAIYVRTSKGKEPVDDHRALLELARRGEDATERTQARMRKLPAVGYLLQTPDSEYPSDDAGVRFVARAAPLTVTPALSEWPLSRRAAEWCLARVDSLVPQVAPYRRTGPHLEPYGRAIAARVSQEHGFDAEDACVVVADSGGVIGAQLRRGPIRGSGPTLLIQAILEDEIQPLATLLADGLAEAEAHGRAIVDLWVLLPPLSNIGPGDRGPRRLHVSRELTVPADAHEVREVALAWHRELQREVGIVKYEDESVS